ncbi:MAG: hypothetical protein AAB791_03715 [Patescibacteria group bacterium]
MFNAIKNPRYQKAFFGLFLIFVFFFAMAVWYSPVFFKGYPPSPISTEMTLAKNISQTGVYGFEDKLNIVLPLESIPAEAEISSAGNKLGPYSFAAIFKFAGWPDWDNLIWISLAVSALSLVFFTIAVYSLFGLEAAVIFPFVYILLPSNWQTAVEAAGKYEFAWLYFSLFVLFFFWGRRQKFNWIYLAGSGLFLALSCLAKEAMFIPALIFMIWLFFSGKKKNFLAVLIPLAVTLSILWVPAMMGKSNNNYYWLFVTNNVQKNEIHTDFDFYGHIFPDSYTFHFNKESILEKLKNIDNSQVGLSERFSQIKTSKNMSLREISILERLEVGSSIIVRHAVKYMSIDYMGGPFIFLLMILGLWQLKKTEKKDYYLFVSWLAVTPFLLSYAILVSRNHLMDLSWPIATAVTLGLVAIFPIMKSHFGRPKTAYVCLVLAVLYGLILANHVFWGRIYDQVNTPEIRYLANQVEGISSRDVIAIGQSDLYPSINYITSKSIVLFAPETISGLIEKKELSSVFETFRVKYIMGYSPEMTDLIIANSQAKNIAVWPEKKMTESFDSNKSWILNLVR